MMLNLLFFSPPLPVPAAGWLEVDSWQLAAAPPGLCQGSKGE